MKISKLFENDNIEAILKQYNIINYTIRNNGIIDVDGDVDLSRCNLTTLPVKFGYVDGYFYCYDNQLTSLVGAPREVAGDFYCSNNLLTSLQYAPREVGSNFWCDHNQLTSLQYAPREVGRSFDCSYNKLTSLQYAPKNIGGSLWCHKNLFKSEPDHSFINIGGQFKWK